LRVGKTSPAARAARRRRWQWSPGLQHSIDGIHLAPLLLILVLRLLLLLVRACQLLLLVLLDPDLLLLLLLLLLSRTVLFLLENKVNNYFSSRSYKFQDPEQLHLVQSLKILPLHSGDSSCLYGYR
jgi:hypothetical protein